MNLRSSPVEVAKRCILSRRNAILCLAPEPAPKRDSTCPSDSLWSPGGRSPTSLKGGSMGLFYSSQAQNDRCLPPPVC